MTGRDDEDREPSQGGPPGAPDEDDLLEGAEHQRRRRVTLRAPLAPVTLPGEDPGRASQVAAAPAAPKLPSEGPPPRGAYDGWMADRLRRSSLPPAHASAIAASTVPPPPRTPPPDLVELEGDEEDDGGALGLVTRSTKSTPAIDLTNEMAERLALDDFSGALRAAELVLGQDPDNETAQHYATVAREKLEHLLTSRLSAAGQVPRVDASESEIRWLGLDPQSGFLLSRIDGESDLETVLSLSGMPRLDALRAMVELVEARVVRML